MFTAKYSVVVNYK